MSTHRISPNAGYVLPSRLPKGPNGRALCRECGTEVPKGRRTFCGQACVDAWQVRTNPAVMRDLVFRRDQGVCAVCGIDTKQLEREYQDLLRRVDLRMGQTWAIDATPEVREWRRVHGIPPGRVTFWDADHIVPVVEGGGECGLENLRTLCVPCHQRVTAELAARRAEARQAAKRAADSQLMLEGLEP